MDNLSVYARYIYTGLIGYLVYSGLLRRNLGVPSPSSFLLNHYWLLIFDSILHLGNLSRPVSCCSSKHVDRPLKFLVSIPFLEEFANEN